MSNTFLTVAYVLLFAMWAISSFVLIPVPGKQLHTCAPLKPT